MSDIAQVELKTKQMPIGEPDKISQFVQQNPLENLAAFSLVKNRVFLVNPNINFPFNLGEGRPTVLGLFLQTLPEAGKEHPPSATQLEVLPHQTRSALLGRVVFKDNDGNSYREVDLKGIGFLKRSGLKEKYAPTASKPFPTRDRGSRSGLLDKEVAVYDYENAEDLIEAGVRVPRTVAIIELEELIVNGKTMTVDEARKKGFIDKKFQPVIEVRAFGTRARVSDAIDTRKPISKLLLEDAKKLVAQELGKDSITDEEYLEWFAETLGRNVAIIRKNGWFHEGLHAQNITLDCRIVDFDSLKTHRPWNSIPLLNTSDFDHAKLSIGDIYKIVTGDWSYSMKFSKASPPQALARYLRIYQEKYDEVLRS